MLTIDELANNKPPNLTLVYQYWYVDEETGNHLVGKKVDHVDEYAGADDELAPKRDIPPPG